MLKGCSVLGSYELQFAGDFTYTDPVIKSLHTSHIRIVLTVNRQNL